MAEDRIVATGGWGRVEYARLSNGESPARDFIEGLSDSDRRKLAALFDRMAEVGQIRNLQRFRKIEGDIWEFKSDQIRIGCFQEGRVWFLTHGFIKKSDKWRPEEKKRAQRIMREHLHCGN